MTCTNPASSEPPSSIMIASSQSWKLTSPSKHRLAAAHHSPCSGRRRVACGGLAGLEAHDRDELPVVGHAVGAAEPAVRAGGELLPPPVHLLAQHRLVRAHPLDDLDEHLNLRSVGAASWRSGPPDRRYAAHDPLSAARMTVSDAAPCARRAHGWAVRRRGDRLAPPRRRPGGAPGAKGGRHVPAGGLRADRTPASVRPAAAPAGRLPVGRPGLARLAGRPGRPVRRRALLRHRHDRRVLAGQRGRLLRRLAARPHDERCRAGRRRAGDAGCDGRPGGWSRWWCCSRWVPSPRCPSPRPAVRRGRSRPGAPPPGRPAVARPGHRPAGHRHPADLPAHRRRAVAPCSGRSPPTSRSGSPTRRCSGRPGLEQLPPFGQTQQSTALMYLSITTMSTLGIGDIAPDHRGVPPARLVRGRARPGLPRHDRRDRRVAVRRSPAAEVTGPMRLAHPPTTLVDRVLALRARRRRRSAGPRRAWWASRGPGKSTLTASLVAAAAGEREPPRCWCRWTASTSPTSHWPPSGEPTARAPSTPSTAPATRPCSTRLRGGGPDTVWAPTYDRSIEESVAGAIAVPAGTDVVVTEGNYLLVDDGPWSAVRGLLDEVWAVQVDAGAAHRTAGGAARRVRQAAGRRGGLGRRGRRPERRIRALPPSARADLVIRCP